MPVLLVPRDPRTIAVYVGAHLARVTTPGRAARLAEKLRASTTRTNQNHHHAPRPHR